MDVRKFLRNEIDDLHDGVLSVQVVVEEYVDAHAKDHHARLGAPHPKHVLKAEIRDRISIILKEIVKYFQECDENLWKFD